MTNYTKLSDTLGGSEGKGFITRSGQNREMFEISKIDAHITLTVAGLEWIQALLSRENDLAGLTVHLKIDSGMGRIGFREASEKASRTSYDAA